MLRFPAHPAYVMIKCVKLDLFRVRMNEINPTEKFVIISVLENFFVDKALAAEEMQAENVTDLVEIFIISASLLSNGIP